MTEHDALLRLARIGMSAIDHAQDGLPYRPTEVLEDALRLRLYARATVPEDGTWSGPYPPVSYRLYDMDAGYQQARATVQAATG